jgi:hypothetical protein
VLITEAGSAAGASIQLQPGVHRLELDAMGTPVRCDGQREWAVLRLSEDASSGLKA